MNSLILRKELERPDHGMIYHIPVPWKTMFVEVIDAQIRGGEISVWFLMKGDFKAPFDERSYIEEIKILCVGTGGFFLNSTYTKHIATVQEKHSVFVWHLFGEKDAIIRPSNNR